MHIMHLICYVICHTCTVIGAPVAQSVRHAFFLSPIPGVSPKGASVPRARGRVVGVSGMFKAKPSLAF